METQEEKNTPSYSVIVPHYIAAAVCFLVSTLLLFLNSTDLTGHYFQPHILAITHLLVLGWATMIIFGSLYQILPVILEVKLFSEALSKTSFIFLLIGTSTIAYSFWNFQVGISLKIGAFLIVSSVTLFLVNIFRTARTAKEIKTDTEFILTAGIWLLLTVLAGTVLAFNLTEGFLPKDHLQYLTLHAHIGIVGWFILLIIGVASRLVPMFLICQPKSITSLNMAYYLINIGLTAFLIEGIIINNILLKAGSIVSILSGILCFLYFIYLTYKGRVRKKLDSGLKQSVLSFIFLTLPLILSVGISLHNAGDKMFSSCIMIYGITIILGFISGLILGKTYKTLPFILLLQLGRRNTEKGIFKLKTQDLYSEKLAYLQLTIYLLSLILMIAGIITRNLIILKAGTLLLLAAAILYNISLIQMLIRSGIKHHGTSNGTR